MLSAIKLIQVALTLLSDLIDYARNQRLIAAGKAEAQLQTQKQSDALVTKANTVQASLTNDILDNPDFDKENSRD